MPKVRVGAKGVQVERRRNHAAPPRQSHEEVCGEREKAILADTCAGINRAAQHRQIRALTSSRAEPAPEGPLRAQAAVGVEAILST